MKSRYEQIDLIGKRTQKAATTVEVSIEYGMFSGLFSFPLCYKWSSHPKVHYQNDVESSSENYFFKHKAHYS